MKQRLISIDVLNTLGGGTSEPFLSLREQPTGQEMRVRVPGIDKEALQIEVNNNELSVFYHIPVASSGERIRFPRMIYQQPVPYFIEVTGIKASYVDRELIVDLPYNEFHDGYSRRIPIGK